jgi:hypothetical protein
MTEKDHLLDESVASTPAAVFLLQLNKLELAEWLKYIL